MPPRAMDPRNLDGASGTIGPADRRFGPMLLRGSRLISPGKVPARRASEFSDIFFCVSRSLASQYFCSDSCFFVSTRNVNHVAAMAAVVT